MFKMVNQAITYLRPPVFRISFLWIAGIHLGIPAPVRETAQPRSCVAEWRCPPTDCWRSTDEAFKYFTINGIPLAFAKVWRVLENVFSTRTQDLLLLKGTSINDLKRKLISPRPSFLRSAPFSCLRKRLTWAVTRRGVFKFFFIVSVSVKHFLHSKFLFQFSMWVHPSPLYRPLAYLVSTTSDS